MGKEVESTILLKSCLDHQHIPPTELLCATPSFHLSAFE